MKNFLSNEFMDRIILLRILGYVEPRTLAEPCQLLPTLKIKKGKKSNVQFADKINYQKRFYRVTFLLNYSLILYGYIGCLHDPIYVSSVSLFY